MTRDDQQLAEFAAQVAKESWQSLNQAYTDFKEQGLAEGLTEQNMFDDCELYLYVYVDGNWTVEHAQYLTDHRNIVAAIPLQLVNGPMELAEQIEQEYNDDDCEEQE